MRNFLLSLFVSLGTIVLLAGFGVGQDTDILPVVKTVPAMHYPAEARETGLKGVVTVGVQVDERGKVTSVGEAAGPDWVCPNVTRPDVVAMREAAKAVAAKATFEPATKDGQAVASTAVVRVEFVDPHAKKSEVVGAQIGGVSDSGTVLDSNGKPFPKMTMSPGATVSGDKPATGGVVVDTAANMKPVPGSSVYADPGSKPKMVSGGVLNGKAMTLTRPKYPAAARAVHASGSVTIQVIIDVDGTVFWAHWVSGHPLLVSAGRLAACSSSFSPTLLEGKPVKVSGVITYNFVP